MRKLINFIVLTMLISVSTVNAQDIVFFSDSPVHSYYDLSWGFANSPSYLERINGDKFPVSRAHYFSGMNSLKLHWKSATGGDWGIAAASKNWAAQNVNNRDLLVFMAYSETEINKEKLPVIYLEDINGNKTGKISLSAGGRDLTPDRWIRMIVPVSEFRSTPGTADLTKIKTVFFGQGEADDTEHTIFLDDIRFSYFASNDTLAPRVPEDIKVTGYGRHIDISWKLNSEPDIYGYNIYKRTGDELIKTGSTPADIRFFLEFAEPDGGGGEYFVTAYDSSGNESEYSIAAAAYTAAMDDNTLLDMIQEATFRYFWDYAHPVSGLARERLGSGDVVTTGGSGFGIMTIPAGIERGYINRQQGAERLIKILNFLEKADRFHGAWAHWMNGTTGKVIPFSTYDDGGDLVETAFMIQGLLAAREYFNGNTADEDSVRSKITRLWESVEWSWYRRTPLSNYLYWHWSPNYGWQMNFRLTGPNETMITYLLAIASPTYGVPSSLYYLGWAGSGSYVNGKTFYGYPLFVGWDYGGPLFFAHYSFLGFDPRNKKDKYANYFLNNRNHTLINRAYCIDNPENHAGYNQDSWGLTASDDPWGYSAHEPTAARDNGTISPTAALSSMPYTPEESIRAARYFYENYTDRLWGIYGFKDAFNLDMNWFADSYLAIDQGPIMVMIENYRSGLLWDNFMNNPEIKAMVKSIGFEEDPTDVEELSLEPEEFKLLNNYPNPFNPSTKIRFSVPSAGRVVFKVYDLLGRETAVLVDEWKEAGEYETEWNAVNRSSGIYFYTLSAAGKISTKQMVLLK